MTSWDTFLPKVLPDVAGCPDVVAIEAVRSSAIELCEKSNILRTDAALFSLAQDDPEVDVSAVVPAQHELHTIAWLGFKAEGTTKYEPVTGPVSHAVLDRVRPTWREDASSGKNAVDTFLLSGTVIRVVPIPVAAQADALNVELVLKPSLDSTDGDDVLYADWRDWIAHGAKWKLMAMRDKSWSNPTLAAFHEREFRRGVSRATAKVIKGGGSESVTVYPRSFV